MARKTFEGWLPEDWDGKVIQKINQVSAVEALANRVPMKTDTKKVGRAGEVDIELIPKGAAYGEDVSAQDTVTLDAQKLGKVIRIAEEDIDDTTGFIDIVNQQKIGWANSYAKYLDNACFGTTAAVGAGVPFESVYKAVRTADAGLGYTADANRVATAGTGAQATYDQLSTLLAKLEAGDYYDDNNLFVVAHPTFKETFRQIKDSTGAPIFSEAIPGESPRLFGNEMRFSLGARTNATASKSPSGNPLIVVGQRSLMLLGIRSGPESVLIDGRDGASALTDETLLKMRARRAFKVGSPTAFAVLERLP